MWNFLPTALLALTFLSEIALARPQDKVLTSTNTLFTKVSPSASPASSEDSVVVIMSTVTVVPLPKSTAPGVFYTGIGTGTGSHFPHMTGTGISSGIFYPGNATGSGSARPTGLPKKNGTSIHTRHHVNSTKISVSLPAFSFATLVGSSSTSKPIPTTTKFPSILAVASPASDILKGSVMGLTTVTASSITPTTSSSSTSTSSIPTTSATTNNTIPFLRGVNLGGWLVLEKWMNWDAFTGDFSSAVDQYTFDSLPNATAALETHWSTFFTEADIQTIAATGINALRIPIGFWAYDNADTPYIQGADAYLEKAIEWARNASMKVWVDCHGSPGSQNGFDNSGRAGDVSWQEPDNLARSISVLKIMAKKYGAANYSDVVVGLEMTNEPISYGNNVFNITQSWAQEAYAAIKDVVENENLVIVMHDAFEGATAWTGVAGTLTAQEGGKPTFGVDTHLYQLFTDSYNAMNQAEHIAAACAWSTDLAAANAVMPTYVGEFSAATNICVNVDGTTTNGTSCTTKGCQCQSTDFADWNEGMIEQVRRFVEAQLDVFESSSSGYFMWSAKGPGGWGFLNGIGNGAIPNPVTSRKYAAQC